jgi:putative acetyltransferase
MRIRDERPDDISRISRIHYAAFFGHPVHTPALNPLKHRIATPPNENTAMNIKDLGFDDWFEAHSRRAAGGMRDCPHRRG